MKFFKIDNKKNSVILFFNGFGLDHKSYSGITSQKYDIIIVSDYTDFSNTGEINSLIEKYSNINIISFSLGVYISAHFINKYKIHFTHNIAINGTLKPLDNFKGIPPRIFDLTIKGFSPEGAEKFYRNIFYHKEDYDYFINNKPERTAEEQKEELIALKNFINNNPVDLSVQFNKVYISDNDKIFPFNNTQNAWEDHEINILNNGHFPFYSFKSWDTIIEETQ